MRMQSSSEGVGTSSNVRCTIQEQEEETIDTACEPCSPTKDVMGRCDACPFCNDICNNPDCLLCQTKLKQPVHLDCHESESLGFLSTLASICQGRMSDNHSTTTSYTMCQVRRHNNIDSAWILVGSVIYDATSYIRNHPGGSAIILRRCGGLVDCTEDLSFHSKRAQREWLKFKVGRLRECHRI